MESVVDPTIGVVVVDLPCRKCGYNVRGMPAGGTCPECGTRVALSLQEDLLRFCDPRWVRTLHRGVRCILWGIVVMVVAAVAGIALAAAGWAKVGEGAAQGMMVLGAAMGFAGSWWLTEPDPSGLGEDRYGTARKLTRVTVLLGVVETLFDLLVKFAGPLPPWVRVMTQSISFVLSIAGLVGLLATLQYVRRLSLRIPDASLANRAHFLAYALGVSYGVLLLVAAAAEIASNRSNLAPAVVAIGCVMLPVGLAMMVFAVMYLVMTIKLGRRLAAQATLAERAWAPSSATPVSPGPHTSVLTWNTRGEGVRRAEN